MSGTTTGVWIPEDSDLLDRYDTLYGQNERSARIREAMELQLVVEEVLTDAGYDLTGRDRRAWVRQALLDRIDAES